MLRSVFSSSTMVSALALGACVSTDPVHDAQVTALGSEVDGVPPGDYHRPGQPCTVCHSAAGPAQSVFSVAGTVFTESTQTSPSTATGACGVQVLLADSNGCRYVATTNCVGNFWVTPDRFDPAFPMKVGLSSDGATAEYKMQSFINRDGSCGGCHEEPAPPSLGRVYASAMNPPPSDCGSCPVDAVLTCPPTGSGRSCFIQGGAP